MMLVPAQVSDLLTLVLSYLAQALGIFVCGLFYRRRVSPSRKMFLILLGLYLSALLPSVLSPSAGVAAAFGLLQSLLCGVLAGGYLTLLAANVPQSFCAKAFGAGYGAATVASWLISLIGDGWLLRGAGIYLFCLPVAALIILCSLIKPVPVPAEETTQKYAASSKALIVVVCAVVLLFSLVNNIGFSFSSGEIQGGLRVEFSRIFYAVSLVAAGFVTDKSRKYGAVCALAALVIPFMQLALRGEPVSTTVFWALGYFGFGFVSVLRVVLFTDISKKENKLFLAGGGLLIGRLGDAAGAWAAVTFSGNEAVRIILAAVLFAASAFAFFKLFQILFTPVSAQKNDREIFNEFAARHDLSAREREVLKLLLVEKRNSEMAQALFVSESTVKFHVHNLLKKTGCKNRVELCNLYFSHKQ